MRSAGPGERRSLCPRRWPGFGTAAARKSRGTSSDGAKGPTETRYAVRKVDPRPRAQHPAPGDPGHAAPLDRATARDHRSPPCPRYRVHDLPVHPRDGRVVLRDATSGPYRPSSAAGVSWRAKARHPPVEVSWEARSKGPCRTERMRGAPDRAGTIERSPMSREGSIAGRPRHADHDMEPGRAGVGSGSGRCRRGPPSLRHGGTQVMRVPRRTPGRPADGARGTTGGPTR